MRLHREVADAWCGPDPGPTEHTARNGGSGETVITDEFPGVGQRLRAAFKARGYWDRQRHTVMSSRFAADHPHHDRKAIAFWTHPKRPRRPQLKNLRILAHDLHTSFSYLLLGDSVLEEQEQTYLIELVMMRSDKNVRSDRTGSRPPPHRRVEPAVSHDIDPVRIARARVPRVAGPPAESGPSSDRRRRRSLAPRQSR